MKITITKKSTENKEFAFSANREFAFCLDAVNAGKDLVIYALQKSNDNYGIIGTTCFYNIQMPANLDILWLNFDKGEIIYHRDDYNKRITIFDFSHRKGIYFEYGAWLEFNGISQNALLKYEQALQLPKDDNDINSFFHSREDWIELTVKKSNGYWNSIDDIEHNYGFVVETESGQCVIYAVMIKPKLNILSALIIPRSISFPFTIKVNFEKENGVFSINDDLLIGIYDYKSLTGILIFPRLWSK